VVPGDVEGAAREVALRMTRAAEEDAGFREQFAQLAATRGGIYACALASLNRDAGRTHVAPFPGRRPLYRAGPPDGGPHPRPVPHSTQDSWTSLSLTGRSK
jgi:hypothetical protein